MLQLVISSLVLGSAVAAPQDYQSYLDQLHQYRLEYLPESVNSYINKTWEEGRDIAYDLYDDIKEEVISKSDVHVDAMTEMMERFFERANEIHRSIKTVLEQEGALTDEEIQEIADKEGLQQLREKFNDLEEELEREAVEDENLPEGVEKMLQGMIRLCRQMMAGGSKNYKCVHVATLKYQTLTLSLSSCCGQGGRVLEQAEAARGPVLPDESCVRRHGCLTERVGHCCLPNNE